MSSSAQSGAERELKALFDAEYAYVCRSLRRLGIRESEVEDMAQEVFLRVFRAFEAYDRERPLRPWLFAFVFHVAANERRRARYLREVYEEPEKEPRAEGDPERAMGNKERRSALLLALEALPFERRAVLVMHEIEGLTAPAIAELVGIPVNTVYSRLRKARQELREAIRGTELGREGR